MDTIRKPVFAGHFYPEGEKNLTTVLQEFIDPRATKEKARAVIVPHAGYMYSGATAGAVLSRIDIPATVIMIGPNHTGFGEPYAVASHKAWSSPIGTTEIDAAFAKQLTEKSRYLQEDSVAHMKEHSLEVQLPFFQMLRKDVRIVPVSVAGYVDDPAWQEIGETIAQTICDNGLQDKVLLAASSDMSHYAKQAEEKDHYAIEAILALDEQLLIRRIYEKDISMCGYGPVIISIILSKLLGAEKAELVKYATSGPASKNYSQVVGYAGIIIR